jgi:DNA repair exonuclease SbcCD nuclease subunit
MPIRIVHTADNHIGINFRQYPTIREKLLEERFAALNRTVEFANLKQAHFLVVAGDLFDSEKVSKEAIRRTVSIFRQFTGQAVLVLAGNHDYFDPAGENKIWKEFKNAARDEEHIRLMTEPGIFSFDCEGEKINFYACPCPSKLSKAHVIDWASGADKSSGEWHIGVAHGNVEGIGLDADQRYFNMTRQELKNAGMHTWLLGHIHVPWPDEAFTGTPEFFMPGIHTPDSVKVKHPGHAWYLELIQGKDIRFESFQPGAIRFERLSMEFSRAGDNPEILKKKVESLRSDGLILDLVLSGRLPAEERKALADWLEEISKAFLHLDKDLGDVQEEADPRQLSQIWPEGTLPNALIKELLNLNPEGDDARLAMELYVKTRKQ